MPEFILKDWHGKDQTFDEETIYIQDKEGQLLPFTYGTGNPVIEPLEVSENGTYEAPAGVDGYSPVTVEVPDPVINKLEVTKNGTYSPQAGVDGYGPVVVNVPDNPAVVRSLEITKNGTYTAPSGVDGYSPVVVNVPDIPPVLQTKEATQNGKYTPDSGYDGLSEVTVNVPGPVLEPLSVTVNGTYAPGAGKDGFNSVTVAVPAPTIKLQEKTITENGEYTADAGFDGLLKVLVDVASSGGANVVIKTTSYYKDTGAAKTVSHTVGVVPDIVMFFQSGTLTGDGVVAAVAFKDESYTRRYGFKATKSGSTVSVENDVVGYWKDAKYSFGWITMSETNFTFPPRPACSEALYYTAIWIDPPQT